MASSRQFPENFLLANQRLNKDLAVVIEIEGLDLLTNRTIYTKIRYGDPGIDYGDPGVIYGGLRRLEGTRALIDWTKSNLSLNQKLEPEQGKGSISLMSLAFVDKDFYLTQALSPGVLIDEILSKPVNVYIGYEQTSYPEDYVKIFRARITEVQDGPGWVTMQLSDPNFQRKGQCFITGKTKLLTPLAPGDTTVGVLDAVDFHRHVLGPDGTYDVGNPWNPDGTYNALATKQTGVRTFFKIEEEWIEYGPLGFGTNLFTGCLRGARNTVAAVHATGADVECAVEITDNALDIAVKTMLSGWNGAWRDEIPLFSIMRTFDGVLLDQPRAIILPPRKDAIRDYGLVEQDFVTINGSSPIGNDGQARIVRFAALFGEPNRIIYVDRDLLPEFPTSATFAPRSQFDVYPTTCGIKLTPEDVDVEKHLELRDRFMSGIESRMRFLLTAEEALKNFIETEIYLPTAAYSLTQRGRLSVGYHIPPLVSTRLVVLNHNNIKEPDKVVVKRGLNSRKFFNEIQWSYDVDDAGEFHSFFRFLDADSLNRFGVSAPLPITSRGIRTEFGTPNEFARRARRFLSRYKNATAMLNLKTFWAESVQIESGDIVAVRDDENLKIANFETGGRDLGYQLFEITDRGLNIKSTEGDLTLVSGIGASIDSRFAIISPSSNVVSGDVVAARKFLIIEDSFSAKFPGDEMRKWRPYVGEQIVMHDENYTYYGTTRILSLDPINSYKMYIDAFDTPPPGFTGMIIDIPRYPNSPSKTLNSIYKQTFAHFGAIVQVATGSSPTQFTVGAGDIAKFFVNCKIRVHKEDYTTFSPEVTVITIDTGTNTITVNNPLGFTPNNTFFITGIGFPDKQGVYRYI